MAVYRDAVLVECADKHWKWCIREGVVTLADGYWFSSCRSARRALRKALRSRGERAGWVRVTRGYGNPVGFFNP